MKKALKILKSAGDIGFSAKQIIISSHRLNKAIKELEDLKNRSCDTCKYNKEQDNFMIFCDKTMCQDGSKMMWHSFTKDFNCKYWEPKQ